MGSGQNGRDYGNVGILSQVIRKVVVSMTRMRIIRGKNMFEMENYEFSLELPEFEIPDVSSVGNIWLEISYCQFEA